MGSRGWGLNRACREESVQGSGTGAVRRHLAHAWTRASGRGAGGGGKGGRAIQRAETRGRLANVGLENAKALIGRFVGAKEADEFAAGGPTAKTLLLLQALRVINDAQGQANPFAMWTNDIGTPGHRGGGGRLSVRMMFGSNDPRYQ